MKIDLGSFGSLLRARGIIIVRRERPQWRPALNFLPKKSLSFQ